MTPAEFIDQAIGKCYTNSAGLQCVALFSYYADMVVGYGISGVEFAYQLWDLADDRWQKIPNTPDGIPPLGAVVVWDVDLGGTGHVAIATGKGDTNQFTSIDINWPFGSCCHYQGHDYTNVIGWLIPKNLQTNNTMDEKSIYEKLWADPSVHIYDCTSDRVNRYAFPKLTGRWNYDGKKVETVPADTVNPKLLAQEVATQKASVALLNAQLTAEKTKHANDVNDANTKLVALQVELDAANKQLDKIAGAPVIEPIKSSLWINILKVYDKIVLWVENLKSIQSKK